MQDYKPKFYYWKLVLLVRKCIFAVIVVLLRSNVGVQVGHRHADQLSPSSLLGDSIPGGGVVVFPRQLEQASLSVAILFGAYIVQQLWSPYITLSAISHNLGLTKHNLNQRLHAIVAAAASAKAAR